jgi:hypothetical protein
MVYFLEFSLSQDGSLDKGNTINMYNSTKIGGCGKYFTIYFEICNALKVSAYSTFYIEISSAKFSLKGQFIFRHNAFSLCGILSRHIHCVLHALYAVCLRRPFILRNMINYMGLLVTEVEKIKWDEYQQGRRICAQPFTVIFIKMWFLSLVNV